jgi:hypothetical protein
MVIVLLIPLRDMLSFRGLWFWLARQQYGLINKFEMPLVAQSNTQYPLCLSSCHSALVARIAVEDGSSNQPAATNF